MSAHEFGLKQRLEGEAYCEGFKDREGVRKTGRGGGKGGWEGIIGVYRDFAG